MISFLGSVPHITEEQLQVQCSDWLNSRYPELKKLFFFHSFQGMKLPIGIRVKAQKSGGLKSNILDFQFTKNNGRYSGLFIELKKPTACPYKENGQLKKDEHLEAQNNTIELLKMEEYFAVFCWTLQDFKTIVTLYLDNKIELTDSYPYWRKV